MDNEYLGSIRIFDITECHYLQQGNRDDVSSYSFNDLMKELMQ